MDTFYNQSKKRKEQLEKELDYLQAYNLKPKRREQLLSAIEAHELMLKKWESYYQ